MAKPAHRALAFTREPAAKTAPRRTIVSAGAAREGGLWPEQPVLSLEETASGIDVFFACEATTWRAAVGAVIRVYAMLEEVRVRVGDFLVAAIPTVTSSDGSTIVGFISVRGHPSDRWDVFVASDRAGTLGEATFSALAWGTESSPEAVGESASLTDQARPAHAGCTFAKSSDGRWYPVGGTVSSGRASLNVAGTITGGSHAMVDGETTPTGAIQAESFPVVYDELNAIWWWARGNSQGYQYVAATGFNRQDGFASYHDLEINNRNDLFVVPGLPDPAAPIQTQNATQNQTSSKAPSIKASAAHALSFQATNESSTALYACIVNKASAPAGGDATVYHVKVAPGASIGKEFPFPLYLSAGLAVCWSTTALTYTDPGGAFTAGTIWLEYA